MASEPREELPVLAFVCEYCCERSVAFCSLFCVVVPANFRGRNRTPKLGLKVCLELRASDTVREEGVALVAQVPPKHPVLPKDRELTTYFCGWVKKLDLTKALGLLARHRVIRAEVFKDQAYYAMGLGAR